MVQRGMNKGVSCFLETIAMDHWVRTLEGERMLERPKNWRGNPVRTELGRGWSGGGGVGKKGSRIIISSYASDMLGTVKGSCSFTQPCHSCRQVLDTSSICNKRLLIQQRLLPRILW